MRRSFLALKLRRQGLSYAQIAERMGISEKTVDSYVYFARHRERVLAYQRAYVLRRRLRARSELVQCPKCGMPLNYVGSCIACGFISRSAAR